MKTRTRGEASRTWISSATSGSEHGSKSEGKDPQQAQPTKKAQYNFTDSESRMLKGPDGFVQGYNTQIAVEPVFQLIVGQRVTQAANDKQQLVPLIEAIEEQSGQKPEGVLADNGYCSDENLKYLAQKRLEGFVATEKQKHGERRKPCPRGPLPKQASRVARMERRVGWLSSLIVAVGVFWFGCDDNLNVSTLLETHIIAMFVS